MDKVVEKVLEEMHPIMRLQMLVPAAAMPLHDYLINGDPAERANFARLSHELNGTFDRALAGPGSLQEKPDLRAAREEWRRAEATGRALLALARPMGNRVAARDMERMDAHIDRAANLLGRMHSHIQREAEEAAARVHAAKRWAIGLVAGIFAVATAIAAAVAIWLARSILAPLRKLEGAAVRFGAGDLSYSVGPLADDEFGRLAETFDAMAQALADDRAALDRHAARLGALNQVAVALVSSLSLEEVLDRIMRHGIALTGARASCIAFYDEATARFTNWVTHGLSGRFVQDMRFRPGSLADEAFASANPVPSNDRPETRHKLSRLAREEGIKGFVCLPLASRDRRLGVIYVYRADRDTFTPEEIGLLAIFTSLAAQAIENARRYGETAEQARTDALTGLNNRREFQRRLDGELERSRRYGHPLALLMLDLDHFKNVNDAYGHLAGDEILRAVAARARTQIRPMDHAARYGGEEFVVVLPETPAAGARTVAERVRRVVAGAPFRLPDGREIALTVSIGVACCPDDADNARTLVERADQALYAAKEAGRDRVMLYGETLKARIEQDPARIVALLNENPGDVRALLAAVASKAAFFHGHADAVERTAARIAAALGLPETDAATLALAARLHDIGMAAIPDAVLGKTTGLEPGDWAQIRRHPAIAAEWLAQVPALEHLAPIVRHHHERWDGGGYPDGLQGEAISFLARVLAVADACAAMTADRPGRAAMAPEEIAAALRAGAGTQFDPAIVQALLDAPA